jgi:hypothetical protein
MEDRRSWWKRFERPGVYKKAPGIDPSKVKKESLSTGSLHSMRMWWKTHGTRPSCQAEATESSGSARAASKNGVKVMGKKLKKKAKGKGQKVDKEKESEPEKKKSRRR